MRRILFAIALSLTGTTGIASDTSVWSERSIAIGKVKTVPAGLLDAEQLSALVKVGEALFTAKFTTLDGAGRPQTTQAIIPTKPRHPARTTFARTSGPDANACSSCHNDPIIGGAGDFTTTTFVAEGFTLSDFDSTDPQFSNERGTNHLMGAGLIELLAREMTVDLQTLREDTLERARSSNEQISVELVTKGVSFGQLTALPDGLVDLSKVEGIDVDLIVRPFGQKGVMTSLRQFTINAMNAHHGMQATERFGKRWTASADFDGDEKQDELKQGDISALVAWQATRSLPVQNFAGNTEWKILATTGRKTFGSLGCSSCHIPELPLKSLHFTDPGPVDTAGTLSRNQVQQPASYDLALLEWAKKLPSNGKGEILIPLFGDLKRHRMTDNRIDQLGNELLAQRFVDRTTFATAELWGVGSTAPYGHRNDMTTLDEVIRAHGGDARKSRDAYVEADEQSRRSIIAFLRSLKIVK